MNYNAGKDFAEATFLTVKEFQTTRKIGKTFVFAEIKAGRLKVVKAGRRTLIPISAANAWDQSLQVKSVSNDGAAE